MATIYHLADPGDWAAAAAQGSYRVSTRGRTLDEVGFVHAAGAQQWQQVRRRFYGDVEGDLLLVEFDADRVPSPVIWEVGDPESAERFPHVYGPLPLEAVIAVRTLTPPHR